MGCNCRDFYICSSNGLDNNKIIIIKNIITLKRKRKDTITDYVLDKEATSHDDLFDAFRLSLMFWH